MTNLTAERLDIRSLVVDSTETAPLFFEPARDIPASYQEKMWQFFNQSVEQNMVYAASQAALKLPFLFPERRNSDDNNKKTISMIREVLNRIETKFPTPQLLASLKMLSSEEFADYDNDFHRNNLGTDIKRMLDYPKSIRSLHSISSFKIAYPEKFTKMSGNSLEWEMYEHLPSALSLRYSVAISLRILFPKVQRTEIFSDSELKDLKDLLNSQMADEWIESSIDRAFELFVLSADEVRITNNGLVITPKNTLNDEATPELPEKRSF